jgi:predicted transcriptional regulator
MRVSMVDGESFVTMFQEALKAVSRDLSGEEARMLLHLMPSLGMNNAWQVLNQRELAVELRMSQPQVSRALRNLAEKQIITKGARMGKGHAYTLNPYFGWKGPFKNHAPAKHNAPPLTLLKGGRKEIADEIAA